MMQALTGLTNKELVKEVRTGIKEGGEMAWFGFFVGLMIYHGRGFMESARIVNEALS